MSVHLFTARWQPATLFVDSNMAYGEEPMVFEHPPRSLIPCHDCRRRRWAEYVEVQVYYDTIVQRCKAGHGCRKEKR